MGFNYLQTDDRDDYFAQFNKRKKGYPRYSISLKNSKQWSGWKDLQSLRTIVKKANNLTRKESKLLQREQIIKELEKLNFTVFYKKLPYITGYPNYNTEEFNKLNTTNEL